MIRKLPGTFETWFCVLGPVTFSTYIVRTGGSVVAGICSVPGLPWSSACFGGNVSRRGMQEKNKAFGALGAPGLSERQGHPES